MFSSVDPRRHLFVLALAILPLSIIYVITPKAFSVRWASFSSSKAFPVVKNELLNVSYHGVSSSGVEHFYNIFYAEDTSGLKRFAPLERYIPPTGSMIDASAPGAFCAQGMGQAAFPFTSPVTNISENCLSLRITRPKGTQAGYKLPVIVWIHGGGSALGTAYDQLYNPDGLVSQAEKNGQPILFVAINYRLGIFGYATNEALRKSKQANAGLRDQRSAFEWVKDHIAAFGGDPDNITAMGQSVGASDIALHLTSFKGKRGVPFHKAVMMSGASGLNFNIKSDLVANNTAKVAELLDCIGTGSDADSQATVDCLRDVPMEKLMNVSVTLSRQLRPPFGELSFYTSFDGFYIPERPSVLLRSGQFTDVPIIPSWVTNDGAWYAPPATADDASVLASFSTFIVDFSEASLQKFLSLYPARDFEHMVHADSPLSAHYYRAAQINRDMWFTCPVVDFTWQYARQSSSDVRIYEMNQTRYTPIFDKLGIGFWRVSHLSDIPYMLNGEVAGSGDNSPEQKQLSALLSGSAAAFAYSGDPTKSEAEVLKDWPPAYLRSNSKLLKQEYPHRLTLQVIGGPHGTGPASVSRTVEDGTPRVWAVEWERLLERCEFINSIAEEIGV